MREGKRKQCAVMWELSQQLVSAVFGLCVFMQPRPTHCLRFLLRSMALTPTHISAFSASVSEPGGETTWHGKEREKEVRPKYLTSICPRYLSVFFFFSF